MFTGYLSDKELSRLYKNALFFCYPSLYEGFGLPPLEAQTQGCPVLISDRGALPEIFADSALYCNPEEINDIRKKLELLVNDKHLRHTLKDSGSRNFKRFDWQKSAKTLSQSIQQQ